MKKLKIIIDKYEEFFEDDQTPFTAATDKKILRMLGGMGVLLLVCIGAPILLCISPLFLLFDIIIVILEVPMYYYNKREAKLFKERAIKMVNDYCYKDKEFHHFHKLEPDITFSLENFLSNIFFFRNELTETKNKMGEVVCARDKRRSLKDIYFLCRTYVDKDVEPIEILRVLMKLVNMGYLGVQRCGDIHKIVFTTQSRHVNKAGFVEYGIIEGKPVSLKMLEEIL